jgi:hypothetical protein
MEPTPEQRHMLEQVKGPAALAQFLVEIGCRARAVEVEGEPGYER